MNSFFRSKWTVRSLVAVVAVGGVVWLVPEAWRLWAGGASGPTEFVTETARRGPMRIVVTERGEVDSLSNATLTSKVEGTTTIISIIPEGAQVQAPTEAQVAGEVVEITPPSETRYVVVEDADGERFSHPVTMGKHTEVLVEVGDVVEPEDYLAGDVLCELDSSLLEEDEKQQQITTTQAEADLEKAKLNVEIQKRQNEADEASARTAIRVAELRLAEFDKGLRNQEVLEYAGEVTLKQQELTQKREDYAFTKRLAKKGYESLSKLEEARLLMVKAEIDRDVAEGKLSVRKQYEHEARYVELKETLDQAKRELERIRRQGAAALVQYEAEYEARTLAYEVEVDKLKRLQRQIAACTLVAPQDGQVVYHSEQRRRSEPTVIEEGATVRERQKIINLPDLTRMKVDATIHESRISNVSVGLPALVEIDAYPGEVFKGEVLSVSSVPAQTNWMQPNLKQYEAEIKLTDGVDKISRLKPGLTAEVEIIVDDREDVLQVPVQSVVAIGEKRYAYVLPENGEPERRTVLVGDSADTDVEILDGIAEGEEVILNPRTKFSKELSELESSVGKEERPRPAERPEFDRGRDDGTGAKTKGSDDKSGKGGPPDASAIMKQNDADGDGKLSRDEAPAPMRDGFDRIDADGDGSVDRGELSSALKRFRGGGGGG